jgi:rhodanese-related sulfurtransferase
MECELSTKKAADMVAEAKAQIDLRGSEERNQNGTIPGAIHADRGLLEFYADPSNPYHKPEMDPDKRVIFHCASGGRSALAAKTLKDMGYSNVAHLEGGYNSWKAAGKPTEE